MIQFKCPTCSKGFDKQWRLERHLNRKNKCKIPHVSQNKIDECFSTLTDELQNTKNELEETKNDLLHTKHDLEETKTIISNIVNQESVCTREHTCEFCKTSFSFETSLKRHKKTCKEKIDNIAIYEKQLNIPRKNVDKLTCRFCIQKFATQPAYSRHMNKGCKEKYEYELKLQKQFIEEKKEAAEQKAQVINNNNNHYENNNIININLPPMNAFGSENLDYITTKLLIKELQNCKAIKQSDVSSIVDRFTKLIHANPAHPENHNVLFKSLNSGFAKVYTENGFQEQQATEVQDGIIQNVHKLIQKKGCDEFDYSSQNQFADVLDDIDVNYGVLDENIKEGTNTRALGKCRNTVKAALYSNKDEIGSTHNLIDL